MRPPASQQPPFAQLTGIRITDLNPDCVKGEMEIRPELTNRNGVAHGGAVMTFTDNLAGTATTANIAADMTTSTIEAKINFFAAIQQGDTALGQCVPLHRGRTTMVWESRITRGDGKLAAIAIHTQMVMPVRPKG